MAAGAYVAWRAFDQSIYDRCTEEVDESASLTIKEGTPIILDSAGRVAALGASAGTPYGVSLEIGHNGTAGQYKMKIARLRAGDVWVIPLVQAAAQNLVGQAGGDLGLVKDATTSYWGGSTANADAQCRVVGYDFVVGGVGLGDTLAPAKVVFHEDKIQVS